MKTKHPLSKPTWQPTDILDQWLSKCGPETPRGPQNPFRKGLQGHYCRNLFSKTLINFSISKDYVACDTTALTANEMYVCIFLCFNHFSVLISGVEVSTDISKSSLGSKTIFKSIRDPLTKKLENCYPRNMLNIFLCKFASLQAKKEETFFRRKLLKQLKLKFFLSKISKWKHEMQHHLRLQMKKTFWK